MMPPPGNRELNPGGISPASPVVRAGFAAHGWHGGVIREDRRAAGPPADAPADAPLVVKVGGSLLVRPDWPALVTALVAGLDVPRGGEDDIDHGGDGGPRRLVVVGGGSIVDGLRAIDAAAPLDQSLVHDLAIDAMRLTARLVADAVGLPVAAAASLAAPAVVLDVPAWLAVGDRRGVLPCGWQVTSDSIAALVAVEHGAGLLLAKSASPPPCPAGTDALDQLAAAGWVDDHFPVAAASLGRIMWAAPRW